MAKLAAKVTNLVDPLVKIPPSVLAASARADALHAATHPTLQVVEEVPEVVAPVAAVVLPITPEVIATPAAAAAPEVNWEHRFNSMKGRYDRSERQLTAQGQQISGLEATLASMNTTRAVTPEIPRSLVTPEETTEYGAEFMDVIGRKATEQFSPEVTALKKQMTELQNRLESVGGTVAQSARTRMQDDLTTAVPNWLVLNENEKFLDWLALPDTYSGAIRQSLLEAAYDRNDTRRVTAFFNGFLAEEAATTPRLDEPLPLVDTTPAKVPLAEFAAPGRAKTAASQLPAEKPSFTKAQVTRFYADVASRKYAGRDDEKNTLERQIHEAGLEGRIV